MKGRADRSHALTVYERSARLMCVLGDEVRQQRYEWAALLEAEGLRRGCLPATPADAINSQAPVLRKIPWVLDR